MEDFIYSHKFPDHYKEILFQYVSLDIYIERYNNSEGLYFELQISYKAVQTSQPVPAPSSSALFSVSTFVQ